MSAEISVEFSGSMDVRTANSFRGKYGEIIIQLMSARGQS